MMGGLAHAIDEAVARALAEDLGVKPDQLLGPASADLLKGDVTTAALVDDDRRFAGAINARERCVVCGVEAARRAFEMLAACAGDSAAVRAVPLAADGDEVEPGMSVLAVEGSARVVLAAERTALDLLMVLSGIATESRRWQQAAGPGLKVYDTRKTYPGLRVLSKHAVAVGGAHNHRVGLWDMVLIKDNHIALGGGVVGAVTEAKSCNPGLAVEVEVESVEDAVAAAEAGADIVMLDNMDDEAVGAAVQAVREVSGRLDRRVEVEVSGSVTIERLPTLAALGVDRVSTSCITLARPVDFGLDEV